MPGVIGRHCLTLIGRADRTIRRAAQATAASAQNMGLDHPGANIVVTQTFQHRTQIIAVGQQARGGQVQKGMAGDALAQPGPSYGLRKGPQHD